MGGWTAQVLVNKMHVVQDFTYALLQHLYGPECVDCDVRSDLLEHGFVFRSLP
jgi:hypothetical protein